MFVRQLFLGIVLWIVCCLLSLFYFSTPTMQAQKSYDALLHISDQARKIGKQNVLQTSEQKRVNVKKQYLFLQQGKRLQWRLTSDFSTFTFSRSKKGKMAFNEYFKNISYVMQEKIAENKEQLVYGLQAEQAIYSYRSNRLEADRVVVKKYLLPGFQFPLQLEPNFLFLQGTAEKITLLLTSPPDLQAKNFRAVFYELKNK